MLAAAMEDRHKRGEFSFPERGKACAGKSIFPGSPGEKVSEANGKSNEIWKVA